MRRISFEDGCYYHIYNRGQEGRNLFLRKGDYERFVSGLYYFNDINFVPDVFDSRHRLQGLTLEMGDNRQELVDIIAWCVMPTHYHLVICQKVEEGITKFMQRLGTGYTMYFNKKYEHRGHVFQGSFQARFIDRDRYLQHVIRYIHLNPLDLFDRSWRVGESRNLEACKKFALKYPWSSLGDYMGYEKLPQLLSPVSREIVLTYNPQGYAEFLWEWVIGGLPADSVISGIAKA